MTTLIYNGNTCDYLHSFGIEPNRIPLDAWDATGYRAFAGDPPFGDSRTPAAHHPWPDGFDYAKMQAAYTADEPSRRPGADVKTWSPT